MNMQAKEVLKFYINNDLLNEKWDCIPMLYPFLGNNLSQDSYNYKIFKKYNYNRDYFTLVDNPEDCDFILVPYRYNLLLKHNPDFINDYLNKSKKYNKPILIDGTGDIEVNIDIPNVYILRVGGYHFLKKANEITIPFYCDDLLETHFHSKLQLRHKSDLPSVSFMGWAHISFIQYIKTFIKEIPLRFKSLFDVKYKACKKGILFRIKAIKILQKSNLVNTNFVIRKSYSGHKKTAQGDMSNLRNEFVNNLLDSDYGLAVRGDANSSVRFFEILSMGRIPVLLDTECNLPLSKTIDYKDFCLIVDFRDLNKIDQIIRDFHDKLTEDDFTNMQMRAREYFVEYLRIDSFTKYLVENLKLLLVNNYNADTYEL